MSKVTMKDSTISAVRNVSENGGNVRISSIVRIRHFGGRFSVSIEYPCNCGQYDCPFCGGGYGSYV